MSLVSVIVPVYNTEHYLEQCVQSLLNQTYTNLEILLIDDGSTDDSPRLCDLFGALDSRVRVIHKINEGLTSSRRVGLQAASGDYTIVLDSDDWISPEAIDMCLKRAEEDDADCVLFSYVREYPGKSIEQHLFRADLTFDETDSERYIHRRIVGPVGEELRTPERLDSLSPICMKFYRTEIARKGKLVSERETGTSEDTVFNLYALDHCRISYLDHCFYHYRKFNPNSITRRYKPHLSEQWDTLYRYFREYVDACDIEEYYLAFQNRVACGMIGLGLNEVSAPDSVIVVAQRLRDILNKPLYQHAFRSMDLKHLPLHWRVFFLLCRWKAGVSLALLLKVINRLRGII